MSLVEPIEREDRVDLILRINNLILWLHRSAGKLAHFLYLSTSEFHSLFIPEHARWPSRVGVSVFLFVSAVWFKMVYSGISITASTLLLVAVSSWFTDLTLESSEGRVTIRVQNDIITGFTIFLISECMIFFCCFWGFLHVGLLPNIFILNNLPPNGILPIWP